MKLGLHDKIDTYVKAYKANSSTQGTAIKAVLEPFKTPSYASRFTQEGLRQTIKEQTDVINADWKKYDKTLNDAIRAVVADANDRLLKAMNMATPNKSDDYAIRIANAREFMKDELAEVSDGMDAKQISALDDALAMILKDFVDDYDTMKLFSKMVEKKIIMVGATGEPALPKTFGKMMKVDSIMNTLNEVKEVSVMLFLHARTNGQEVVRINGLIYGIPSDGYSEMADEQTILDNASILDALAEDIDDECHSESIGSGQKIDL